MASNTSSSRPGIFKQLQALEPKPLVIVANDENEMWSERTRFLQNGWAEDWNDELPMPGENFPFPMVIVGYRDKQSGYMLLWCVYHTETGDLRITQYACTDRYKRSQRGWDAEMARTMGYPHLKLWQQMRVRAGIIAKAKKI